MKIQSKIYSISDFYSWNKKGELNLQPRFQRRKSWSPTARSFLIDTILKGLPIPKIFVREQIDLQKKATIRDVVDGQQRLGAILDFINGNLKVKRTHNKDFGDKFFDELDEDIQKEFLSYPISTDLLLGATDADVLNIFSRINSYTLTLNQQEKINAQFIGPFKQTVYSLAHSHYEYWTNNKVLTDGAIARMADAELVSELISSMLGGIQGGKTYIKKYYAMYEEEFPFEDKITAAFSKTIDSIEFIFEGRLKSTEFKRPPLFMSLYLSLYDVLYGFEDTSFKQTTTISSKSYESVYKNLMILNDEINEKSTSSILFNAATRRTSNPKERNIRHKFFKEAIIKGIR
jgi:hypothetical protein